MGLPGLVGVGGIGKRPWVSQACWRPDGRGGGIGKRPWVSQARWGDRVIVADTMVISSRVVGLLQTPWISY